MPACAYFFERRDAVCVSFAGVLYCYSDMGSQVTIDWSLITKMLSSPAFTNFVKTYNLAVTVLLSVVTITIMVLLFLNVSKLSTSADNQFKRREAIGGVFVCLICLAVAGGVDTVYAILLSIVYGFWG